MSNPNHLTVDPQISPIAHDDLQRMLNQVDESDPEILRFFETEALLELKKIENYLLVWEARTTEFPLEELRHCFHTLKGAGNSVGQLRIGGLAGGMERVLLILKVKSNALNKPLFIKCCIHMMQTIRLLLAEARSPGHYPTTKRALAESVDLILEMQHKLAVSLPA